MKRTTAGTAGTAMTAAPKFTPGPWHVVGGDTNCISFGGTLENPCIVIADSNDRSKAAMDEDCANAARIVQCVNAHDDLVAALKACSDELVRVTTEVNKSSAYTGMMIDDARAALAKVQQ